MYLANSSRPGTPESIHLENEDVPLLGHGGQGVQTVTQRRGPQNTHGPQVRRLGEEAKSRQDSLMKWVSPPSECKNYSQRKESHTKRRSKRC
jgi:hypothetical protein